MPKQPELTTPLTPLAATLFWSVFHAAWGLDRDSSHYNKAAWQHVHQVLLATAGQHLDSQLLAYALRNAPQEVRSTLPVLLNKGMRSISDAPQFR